MRPNLRPFLFFLASAAAFLAPVALRGDVTETARSFRVRWLPVEGVERYRVEVQTADGRQIVGETVEGHFLDLGLEPGPYAVRVTSLNKFGREVPGATWHPFRVDPPARVSPFDPVPLPRPGSFLPDRGRRSAPHEPREPRELASESGVTWRAHREAGGGGWAGLVPGLVQYRRGETTRAALFPGVLFASLGFGIYGYVGSENAREQIRGDPLFTVYNNPLPYLLLRETLLAAPLNGVLFASGYRNFLAGRAEYARHRREQIAAGGIFAFVYLLHLVDAYFLGNPGGERPQFQTFLRERDGGSEVGRFWEAGVVLTY